MNLREWHEREVGRNPEYAAAWAEVEEWMRVSATTFLDFERNITQSDGNPPPGMHGCPVCLGMGYIREALPGEMEQG